MDTPLPLRLVFIHNIGEGVVANRPFAKGETIVYFTGEPTKNPIWMHHALQIGIDTYLESEEGIDNFINHSCAPNARVVQEGDRYKLVALRPIPEGEQATFDYCTTEYDMVNSGCAFKCRCGADNCREEVKGYRWLSKADKFHLLGDVLPYIREHTDAWEIHKHNVQRSTGSDN